MLEKNRKKKRNAIYHKYYMVTSSWSPICQCTYLLTWFADDTRPGARGLNTTNSYEERVHGTATNASYL